MTILPLQDRRQNAYEEESKSKRRSLVSTDGNLIKESNSLPVKDIDGAERASLNTVFGEKIIGIRKPSSSAQFQYGIPDDFADVVETNGGTVFTEDSLLKLSTGTDIAGFVSIQTKEYLRYIPGHEAYLFFTRVFVTGVANSFQRAGLYDGVDGFYFGYEGADFCVCRLRAGVVEQKNIDLTKVFEDGSFDPTLGNVYRISFGYLGFATIHFEVMTPEGNWVLMEEFKYPNTSTLTHITQTNLPARTEVGNTGNNTDLTGSVGSFTLGIVDGGGTDPSSRIFTDSNVLIPVTAGISEIITVRNKTTFNSIENRIKISLLLLSIATELNRPVSWSIIKNATFTNTPTFADFNTNNSVVEISTDATINPATGITQLAWNMAKEESFFEQIEDLMVDLRAGEHATFVTITPVGTSGTVNLAVRWKELF